jgi:hypothetical protein
LLFDLTIFVVEPELPKTLVANTSLVEDNLTIICIVFLKVAVVEDGRKYSTKFLAKQSVFIFVAYVTRLLPLFTIAAAS